MVILKLNIKKFLLILLILFIYPANILLANEQIIKVYYSGFSFSNTYDSNKSYAKYTADLIQEKNSDTGIDIISSKLLKTIKKIKFDKIDLDTDNLLDFSTSMENQLTASVMTGKNLNFQRARELALVGDTEGMMREVLNQVGSEEEFLAWIEEAKENYAKVGEDLNLAKVKE